MSGTGSNTTRTFKVSTTWGIVYSYTCSTAFGGSGNFIVTAETPTTTQVGFGSVNQIGSHRNGRYIFHTGGTVHLQVISECQWNITVLSQT